MFEARENVFYSPRKIFGLGTGWFENVKKIIKTMLFEPAKLFKTENNIIGSRRANYKLLSKTIKPVFKLKNEVPYAFPVIVKNRNLVLNKLRKAGIQAIGWPKLPNEVKGNEKYKDANWLAEHVILLPAHQDLDEKQVKYVVDMFIELNKNEN